MEVIIIKKLSLKTIEIIGFFAVSLGAVVFHFLYELLGKNIAVGFISPVNESVWEHSKILIFPFLLYTIFEALYTKVNIKKLIVAKVVALYLMIALMIIVFYTYSGIIGQNISIVDILSTFVYIAVGYYVSYKILTANYSAEKYFAGALIALIILLLAVVVFTVAPPHIPLFQDSMTGKYGMFALS